MVAPSSALICLPSIVSVLAAIIFFIASPPPAVWLLHHSRADRIDPVAAVLRIRCGKIAACSTSDLARSGRGRRDWCSLPCRKVLPALRGRAQWLCGSQFCRGGGASAPCPRGRECTCHRIHPCRTP